MPPAAVVDAETESVYVSCCPPMEGVAEMEVIVGRTYGLNTCSNGLPVYILPLESCHVAESSQYHVLSKSKPTVFSHQFLSSH